MKNPLNLGIFLVLIVSFLLPLKSTACSCAKAPSPEKAIETADIIFVGAVIDFKAVGEPRLAVYHNRNINVYKRQAEFAVKTVWKGPHEKRIVILTGEGGGDCGFDFVVGHEYLVYAHKTQDGYSVGICGRTCEVWFNNWEYAKEDFDALGSGVSITK